MKGLFSIYNIELISKIAIILTAIIIAVSTFFVTSSLADSLAQEEKSKMQLWAAATSELATMDTDCDVKFVQSVITRNTTIPVILTGDSLTDILSYRNIDLENTDSGQLKQMAKEFAAINDPIEIDLGNGEKQYICYGESKLLKNLSYYPIVYIVVFLLYALLLTVVLIALKRAEQNRVWIGLTKETAHQLGTPISSLLAWTEILKSRYPEDDMLPEMEQDVQRLRTIAERFSQVGSKQELALSDLNAVTKKAFDYMRARISKKINMEFSATGNIQVMLNAPLFEWVMENLCKNAVDAMENDGTIRVQVRQNGNCAVIDISDTGKGLPMKNYKRIFYPGFTTKKRGWGLGLSLAKRIIEEYHHGKIYVKHSEIGKGTTFRIELPV
ncbi:MAG: HAMP domain-containing histidine kinase [Bacteroidetes bacterium]|uniref:histidine kinase n=1 Tax=Candidatus Enterocola intestinipullorum TaxID=2840783 RepID=A0A9D9EH15_9BACT|nr:HAMP domain-containing histidine kinase [Candidatus Enterocola intestinipullorum]